MFVNISRVFPPGPNSSGKYGAIVTTEGVKIQVPIHLLTSFSQGMSCEIGTKEQTWGGNPVIVATSGPGGMPQGQTYGQGYQASNQAGASQRASAGFQPKVIQGGAGMPVQAGGSDQARHIYVTGIVGRAMGSGKFAASEIAVLTAEANRSFDLIGKRPPAQENYTQNTEPVGEPQGYAGDPGPELQ